MSWNGVTAVIRNGGTFSVCQVVPHHCLLAEGLRDSLAMTNRETGKSLVEKHVLTAFSELPRVCTRARLMRALGRSGIPSYTPPQPPSQIGRKIFEKMKRKRTGCWEYCPSTRQVSQISSRRESDTGRGKVAGPPRACEVGLSGGRKQSSRRRGGVSSHSAKNPDQLRGSNTKLKPPHPLTLPPRREQSRGT